GRAGRKRRSGPGSSMAISSSILQVLSAQPLTVQLRPPVLPKQTAGGGGPAGGEVEVGEDEVLVSTLAAGQDAAFGVDGEGLAREVELPLDADPVGEGGEVAVLEGGEIGRASCRERV